ncbi:hypothetical protein MUCCIDRAFT_157316 [Mucor lusitanicus CBS 277.49]|uniref:Formamidopyrimidine-DNA glycosylase catalytic domain-containing protein n=1 Tax=Mucor lusitanicus CBS 277.49 TaxID=747725 RepID=A0A162Q441_MUCCL|nr:hypothetical protein MUCCIDRAFT_157316 [Mucor lusitanicus CBS 277.49]
MAPDDFAKTMLNKTLVDTKRWGKYFILIFDEEPHLVAHLGMTGGIRFEHEELGKGLQWPPRFHKLLVTFTDPATNKEVHFGYKDPLRWGKLRLVSGDPLTSDPINKLGFDPVLGLPDIDTFRSKVQKRSVPVKALLLDQSFSAGVGNWVADEILYQAMIHPAQYTNTLTEKELDDMYYKMKFICETAVEAEADEDKFPDDWLMKHRWNKGKKNENKGRLPNGMLLQFETVGGRTSAFAPERQVLRVTEENTKVAVKRKRTVRVKKQEESDEDEDLSDEFDDEDDYADSKSKAKSKSHKSKRKPKAVKKEVKVETKVKEEQDNGEVVTKRAVRTVSSRYNFRR